MPKWMVLVLANIVILTIRQYSMNTIFQGQMKSVNKIHENQHVLIQKKNQIHEPDKTK